MIGIDLKSVFKSRKHTTTHIETNKKVVSKTSSNVVTLKENKREISAERYEFQTMPPHIKHHKIPIKETVIENLNNSIDKNKIKLNNTKHVYIKLNEEIGIFNNYLNNYKRNSKSMSKIKTGLPKNKSSQSSATINDISYGNDYLLNNNLNSSNKYFTEKSDIEAINVNNISYGNSKPQISFKVQKLSKTNEIAFQIDNEKNNNTESIGELRKIVNIMKEVMTSQKKIYEESNQSLTNTLNKIKEENLLLSAKNITLISENNSLKVKILKLIDSINRYENESLDYNNQFKVRLLNYINLLD